MVEAGVLFTIPGSPKPMTSRDIIAMRHSKPTSTAHAILAVGLKLLDGAKMTAAATPAAITTQVRMVVAPQQNSRFRVLSGGGKGGSVRSASLVAASWSVLSAAAASSAAAAAVVVEGRPEGRRKGENQP